MKLSEHFDSSEFACRCGCGFGENPGDVSPKLIELLEKMRETTGPLYITSGCRCPKHNRAIGGVDNSAHERGTAADLKVCNGRDRFLILSSAFKAGCLRVGDGARFIHVDVDTKLETEVSWRY